MFLLTYKYDFLELILGPTGGPESGQGQSGTNNLRFSFIKNPNFVCSNLSMSVTVNPALYDE
jgi:hypothetical protein